MTAPCAVLDTNVALDWLVFDNPGVRGLIQAILAGQVRWILCAGMRAELAHVLTHARLGEHQFDPEQVLTLVDRVAVAVDDPSPQALIRPRCSDASDQIFIDLALSCRARWLLSRDRAVLRLARKVALQGLLVQVPEAWQMQDACPSSA